MTTPPRVDISGLALDEPLSPENSLPISHHDTENTSPAPAVASESPRVYKRLEREAVPIPEFDPPPWQAALESFPTRPIPDPQCLGHTELPNAHDDRARVSHILAHLPSRLPLPSTNGSVSPSNHDSEREFDDLLSSTQPVTDALSPADVAFAQTALFTHLRQGLALTTGSALGSVPPGVNECLRAYLVPNRVGLTAGARAWAKHAHRSMPVGELETERELEGEVEVDATIDNDAGISISTTTDQTQPSTSTTTTSPPLQPSDADANQIPEPKLKPKTKTKKKKAPEMTGWWGSPKGSQSSVNARALDMFFKIMNGAGWRNLHWLPHEVLVYEVRVREGYGMRWSRDQSGAGEGRWAAGGREGEDTRALWMFRGFVEPMMENGHEVGWKHPLNMGLSKDNNAHEEP